MTRFVIIPAPSALGLRSTGVERMPDAMLAAGLADRLEARVAAPVRPGPSDARLDSTTGFLNLQELAGYTPRLADAVGGAVRQGAFPVVLGGDCSILLGALLGLRRRGHYGLLFVDGHSDFYQPEANVNGEAASSDLALVTGRGPAALTAFEGFEPLVQETDVVVAGFRDAAEAAAYGSQALPASMPAFDLATLRAKGPSTVGRSAVEHLIGRELQGFWIHFDVDVLDDAIMPAVDYRQPGGLSWAEAAELLTPAIASGRAVGIDVTIFNPDLDSDGRRAAALVDLVATVLRSPRE